MSKTGSGAIAKHIQQQSQDRKNFFLRLGGKSCERRHGDLAGVNSWQDMVQ